MGLSCSCDEWDGDGEYWTAPNDYSTMKWRSRRRKCCSCKKIINVGEIITEFARFRGPLSDIEERISGDEIPLVDYYMCENCSDIFFNLDELKFCVDITENMNDLLRDYKELYVDNPYLKALKQSSKRTL